MKTGRIGIVSWALILMGAVLVVAYIYAPLTTGLCPPVIAILVGAFMALPALLLRNRGLDQSGALRAAAQLVLSVIAVFASFWLVTGLEAGMAQVYAEWASLGADCFAMPCPERDYKPGPGTGEELQRRLLIPPSMRYPCYSNSPSVCADADKVIDLNLHFNASEGSTLPGLTWTGYMSRVSVSLFAPLAACAAIWLVSHLPWTKPLSSGRPV